MENLLADVLIVGGGLAALSAAIESLKCGARVILADKGRVGGSGSSPSSAGSPQAYLPADLGGHPGDSREIYLADILRGGSGLNNPETASILAKEAQEAVLEGSRWGIPFGRTPEGRFETYITSGMSYPRVGPVRGNGRAVAGALRAEAIRRGARMVENVMVTRLTRGDGRVTGAIGIHTVSGASFCIQARCTILAAGSALAMYPFSSAADSTTGDAYALAWELGLPLANMEFVEFTLIPAPRGIPFPSGGIKPTLGAGAKFYNRLGQRFMAGYDPERMELTDRSALVQAVYAELRAGNGPCCLDVSGLADPTMPFQKIREQLGIDWRREKIPWVPAAHTFLGGVVIDHRCSAGIPGLYAAGETAGHGFAFGAGRVCGAIAACLVLGRRAGQNAAREALEGRNPTVQWSEVRQEEERWRSMHRPGGDPPDRLRRNLQEACWDYAGITRSAGDLEKCLEIIDRIDHAGMRAGSVKDLVSALETGNLALAAKLVARAALARTESRGLHRRRDYLQGDDRQWLKWVALRKEGKGMAVSTLDLPEKDPRGPGNTGQETGDRRQEKESE